MREIKFRIWDLKAKQWLRSYKIVFPFKWEGNKIVPNIDETDNFHITQYTGLRDKNGKEIYEGDLIEDSESEYIGEVIFDPETLCFTTKFQKNELWGFVPRHGRDNQCEVIGNIFENSELLEEVYNATR